eukprot:8763535-Pyramimonas_sp.AAC.1
MTSWRYAYMCLARAIPRGPIVGSVKSLVPVPRALRFGIMERGKVRVRWSVRLKVRSLDIVKLSGIGND